MTKKPTWITSPEARALRALHAASTPGMRERAASARYTAFANLVALGDSPAIAFAKVTSSGTDDQKAADKRAAEKEIAERKERAKRSRDKALEDAKQLRAFEALEAAAVPPPLLTREERVKRARIEARRQEITASSAAVALRETGVYSDTPPAPNFSVAAAPNPREARRREAERVVQRRAGGVW